MRGTIHQDIILRQAGFGFVIHDEFHHFFLARMTDPSQPLREQDVDPDPVAQFAKWFDQAASAGVSQPEAVALATATTDGAPSVRMVLVKRADHDGFVFFTNYESRKGGELAANPRAALLFHWEPFGRQVRIEGPVVRTTREESEAYAHSRARGSQLSAAASPQSAVVERREILDERVAALDRATRRRRGPRPRPLGRVSPHPRDVRVLAAP